MPTARELLEQADALMRRNRTALADDIPVLTEAVSPTPVLRVPLRPSPESPPMPLEDEAPDGPAAPGVIPTLTEKVPTGEPSGAGAILAEGEPSDWLDFDEGEPSITGQAPDSVMSVPEVVTAEALRDASDVADELPAIAEEIELAPAEAEFEAEMEGEHAPEALVDTAPDFVPESFAAPPAPDASAEALPADRADDSTAPADLPASFADPRRADEPAPDRAAWLGTELPPEVEALPALAAEAELVFDSPTSVSWNVEAVLAGSAEEEPVPTAPGAEPLPPAETASAFAALPATEADEPMLGDARPVAVDTSDGAPSPPADDVSLVPSPAAAFAPMPGSGSESESEREPIDTGTRAHAFAPSIETTDASAPPAAPFAPITWDSHFATLTGAVEPPVTPAPPPPPAAPAAPAITDDARWEAMAEEIRMQVLQRIDLFTDEGLREQLGQRLQPIVDRASADLVRTINQHVGELLRAYVAEAIEREIERWRTTQQ